MASWSDGITSELGEIMDDLRVVGSRARTVAQHVIDEEVSDYADRVTKAAPMDTGGLRASHHVQIDKERRGWYGYNAQFEGKAPNGEPYEKIANILNYGTPKQAGTRFVSKAVHRLKGLSNRIEARIEAECEKTIDEYF